MKKHSIKYILASLVLMLGAVPAALAQQGPRPPAPAIRASGESIISVQPDRAFVAAGVVTESSNAQEAAAQNAQQAARVIAALRELVGQGGEVKTISYTLNPKYNYPRDGGQPTLVGYTATNIVQARTDNLEQVGRLIDAAIRAGANNIHSLRFALKDEQAAQAEALRQAAARARAKADALAAGLSLKLGRILLVEESGPVVRPYMDMAMTRAEAANLQTPIEPGTIEIRATVTISVEILN